MFAVLLLCNAVGITCYKQVVSDIVSTYYQLPEYTSEYMNIDKDDNIYFYVYHTGIFKIDKHRAISRVYNINSTKDNVSDFALDNNGNLYLVNGTGQSPFNPNNYYYSIVKIDPAGRETIIRQFEMWIYYTFTVAPSGTMLYISGNAHGGIIHVTNITNGENYPTIIKYGDPPKVLSVAPNGDVYESSDYIYAKYRENPYYVRYPNGTEKEQLNISFLDAEVSQFCSFLLEGIGMRNTFFSFFIRPNGVIYTYVQNCGFFKVDSSNTAHLLHKWHDDFAPIMLTSRWLVDSNDYIYYRDRKSDNIIRVQTGVNTDDSINTISSGIFVIFVINNLFLVGVVLIITAIALLLSSTVYFGLGIKNLKDLRIRIQKIIPSYFNAKEQSPKQDEEILLESVKTGRINQKS